MGETVPAEEQHAANRRHRPALVGSQEPEGLHTPSRQLPDGGKQLGSDSEVEGFRVECRHWAFVEGPTAGETLQFGNELRIGLAVGGAHPNVGAGLARVM